MSTERTDIPIYAWFDAIREELRERWRTRKQLAAEGLRRMAAAGEEQPAGGREASEETVLVTASAEDAS